MRIKLPFRSRAYKMRLFVVGAVLCCLLVSISRADLKKYETKYYTIYTDLDPDDVKEAAIRMTKMAEEYHDRTKGFAGQITKKFPFYLYKSAEEYYAAGGMAGTAGVYMSRGGEGKLMAIAGKKLSGGTWHTVQHEGFHQFAHAVIGGDIPTWLNEGLAEYFGESLFTGDGFVTGIIPPWRLKRLKQEIDEHSIRPLQKMMNVSSDQWASEMNIQNYDQAWSMVHFLVHGDDQKYQGAFSECIRQISKGKTFNTAWADSLGSADGFELQWKRWWIARDESPTRVLYGKAAVATMTSFVARAYAAKQVFANFEAFHSAVDDHTLKSNADDWLPPGLIVNAFEQYGKAPHWELSTAANKQPTVILVLADQTRITGTFTVHGTKIDQVHVDIDDMARILKEAQSLLDAGKKDQAKAILQTAMKDMPRSAMQAQARLLLSQCR